MYVVLKSKTKCVTLIKTTFNFYYGNTANHMPIDHLQMTLRK